MPLESFNKNKINNSKESIYYNFTKSFDQNEVINSYLKPDKLVDDFYNNVYYKKYLGNGFNYVIYGKDPFINEKEGWREGQKFDFLLSDDLKKWDNYSASFIFTERYNEKGIFDFHHRMMRRRCKNELGISGDDYLQKTEEYLKILKNNNLLNINLIKSEVSQLSVFSWLIRNKFNINKQESSKLELYFKYEDGNFVLDENERIQLNDNNLLIPVEIRHNIIISNDKFYPNKDEYIIKKDFFINPEFEELRNRYYKDGTGDNLGKKVLVFDGGRRGGYLVKDLVKVGVMPRFTLEKDI